MLSALLVSNDRQVERVVSWVLAERRRKVGVLGLSFKSDPVHLRESPIGRVVETLLGKGCDLAMYDAKISLLRLSGANRRYIEREAAHVSSLMRNTIQEVMDHAQVLLIANKAPEFRAALAALRPDQKVFDLVGIMDQPEALDGRYDGICC